MVHRSYLKRPDPARAYIKRGSAPMIGGSTNANFNLPWRLPQLCASYGWPTGLAGGGVIGIIELGGGWVWEDVGRFFGSLNQPVPKIGDFSVDGSAMNNGDVTDPASAEVALDIQVAGASYFAATGKPATIRMYWAANTLDAIAQGITKAAADGCDTISISWGASEQDFGLQAAQRLEAAALAASRDGTVIFAASGDNDAGDGSPGENVDLPASAPHIIGCGGTTRPHNSNLKNPEIVWNNSPPGNPNGEGSGGGFSQFFPMSSWMSGAPGTMRMVPDVTACGDPATGYHILLDGQDIVVGGTSAVAPLYAGLLAACGRKLGFISPLLWANQLTFNDIIAGDNGFYRARPGPDPCSGLGSPIGSRITRLFL